MSPIATGILFGTLNIVFWLLVYLVQSFESSMGKIAARRTPQDNPQDHFLYFQDYSRGTWGDAIGLTLIDAVAGYGFVSEGAFLIEVSLVIGICATALFQMREVWIIKRHNFAYLGKRMTSLSGYMHLFYFFLNASVAASLLLLLATDHIGPQTFIIALVGFVIYLGSCLADYRKGIF